MLLSYIGVNKTEDAELLVLNCIALSIKNPIAFTQHINGPNCPFSNEPNIVNLHEEAWKLGVKYKFDYSEAYKKPPVSSLRDPVAPENAGIFSNRSLFSQKAENDSNVPDIQRAVDGYRNLADWPNLITYSPSNELFMDYGQLDPIPVEPSPLLSYPVGGRNIGDGDINMMQSFGIQQVADESSDTVALAVDDIRTSTDVQLDHSPAPYPNQTSYQGNCMPNQDHANRNPFQYPAPIQVSQKSSANPILQNKSNAAPNHITFATQNQGTTPNHPYHGQAPLQNQYPHFHPWNNMPWNSAILQNHTPPTQESGSNGWFASRFGSTERHDEAIGGRFPYNLNAVGDHTNAPLQVAGQSTHQSNPRRWYVVKLGSLLAQTNPALDVPAERIVVEFLEFATNDWNEHGYRPPFGFEYLAVLPRSAPKNVLIFGHLEASEYRLTHVNGIQAVTFHLAEVVNRYIESFRPGDSVWFDPEIMARTGKSRVLYFSLKHTLICVRRDCATIIQTQAIRPATAAR